MCRMGHRPFLLAAAAGAGFLAYKFCLRPRYMRWGATDEEVRRELPGDDLTSNSAWQATRAITIHAPAQAVWARLMRIGDDRGMGPGHELRVGDSVWVARPDRCGGRVRQVVALLEPNRAMVLVAPTKAERLTIGDPGGEGSWAFVLEPTDERVTRLLVRTRAGENLGFLGWLYTFCVADPAQFLMERPLLLDIKARAEEMPLPG